MVSKIYKITHLLFLVFFYQNIAYSKTFDQKNVYNYFSALVSLEKNQSIESINYFKSSKELKESHLPYIKKYVFSLVLGEKISKAIMMWFMTMRVSKVTLLINICPKINLF